MLYKTVREQARINSLLKNFSIERRCEKMAWEMFTKIYGQVQGWVQNYPDEKSFKLDFLSEENMNESCTRGLIKPNIKHFKMIFNRALRVKSRDIKTGEKMFLHLLD